MNSDEHLPNDIKFSDKIIFHTDYFSHSYKPGNRTDTITEKRGYLKSATIYGFDLSDAEIVTFMSILGSFLKNYFPTNRKLEIDDFTVQVLALNRQPTIEIQKAGFKKKEIDKFYCGYIIDCYNIVKREFNIKSATMFYTKI